jgi:hypothetical protein
MSERTLTCRPIDEDPAALVRRHLAEPVHHWSVGAYGAIGEFNYDAGEPGLSIDLDALWVRTARGALAAHGIAHAQPFAVVDETGRIREIAFCSPRPGSRHDRITSAGERTYDVGIGFPHIDMLVRIPADDDETDRLMAGAVGRPLMSHGNPAGAAIARTSPTRILQSPIARLEVHQPIPPPGGRSPEGPHTHLLPSLLAERRAHPPNSPLPDGLYCGLSLYPRRRRERR